MTGATVPPRTVWVASMSQVGLSARDHHEMADKMLARMEQVVPMQPDIICLPEVFPFAGLTNGRPPLEEVAEAPIGPLSAPFAEFARAHRCYVICPIYTVEDGRYYNAAVVIGRNGECLGEYRKICPTLGEMERGITPGPLDPPVFETDFGVFGVQICWDINWHENWRRLQQKGAEIVFWASAFAGGQMLNALAWIHKYYVISSVRHLHPAKIVNPLGEDVVLTGRAAEWLCAPVNLDVAVIQTVVEIRKLEQVRAKYGRLFDVRIKHDEAWALIEGRSAEVSVPEVLAEFGIETSAQFLARNEAEQAARRPAGE